MIIKSTKHSVIAGALQSLTGIVSVQDIIDAILQISNFKETTLKNIPKPGVVKNGTSLYLIFVDMDYQRRIALLKLTNKIKKQNGFSIDAAGAIDIATRPDGRRFVWDGLRRCVKAGLCGYTQIDATILNHPASWTEEQCQQEEARLFKIRNAEHDKVSPEELFKCEVVSRTPWAIQLLSLLKDAKLDVEGLNRDPDATILGGFAVLRDEFTGENRKAGEIDSVNLIKASEIIRKIKWKNSTTTLNGLHHANVSVMLLCGLHYLLVKNEEYSKSLCPDNEIYPAIKAKVEKIECPQSYFTKERLTKKQIKSTAWLIATKASLDDNGLKSFLGLDSEDEDMLEEMA